MTGIMLTWEICIAAPFVSTEPVLFTLEVSCLSGDQSANVATIAMKVDVNVLEAFARMCHVLVVAVRPRLVVSPSFVAGRCITGSPTAVVGHQSTFA